MSSCLRAASSSSAELCASTSNTADTTASSWAPCRAPSMTVSIEPSAVVDLGVLMTSTWPARLLGVEGHQRAAPIASISTASSITDVTPLTT